MKAVLRGGFLVLCDTMPIMSPSIEKGERMPSDDVWTHLIDGFGRFLPLSAYFLHY